LARTPRTWQGARNPSGLKRVRQSLRRRAILQPRRAAAKTLVTKAVAVATTTTDSADAGTALREALSALDRAAKVGAIHPNAAARRKSRLARKVDQIFAGAQVTSAHVAKTTGKAAAAKAAKARITASRAEKAKGAQTAAGKARAALARTTRSETETAAASTAPATPAPTRTATPKSAAPKATSTRSTATKSTGKAASTAAGSKPAAPAAAKATTRAKKSTKTE